MGRTGTAANKYLAGAGGVFYFAPRAGQIMAARAATTNTTTKNTTIKILSNGSLIKSLTLNQNGNFWRQQNLGVSVEAGARIQVLVGPDSDAEDLSLVLELSWN